jgi:uncharacterized protein YbjT (DUF2867 family)
LKYDAEQMILVTGATGNVGRHVVDGLAAAGEQVRQLSRTPKPGFVRGDLREPESLHEALEDVDKVFLLWPGPDATGAEAAVETLAKNVRRIVYLSAIAAETGFWGVIENVVRATDVDWTFLRAGGFATNTLGWADMIRTDGVVRWPYGEAARSLIHERDLADVAVRALTEDGHSGRRYDLTGPELVTQADQVRQIGEAIGRDVRWAEVAPETARAQLIEAWGDATFVDGALTYWASLLHHPEPVTGTVEQLTGRPARTFRQWARDHAADFGGVVA